MRLGGESVGRWGVVILAITGVLGVVLAVHGWSTRSTGLPRATLGNGRSATAPPSTRPSQAGPSTQGPSTPEPSTPGPSPSTDHHRPLLSAQPYANVAYQIWPGTQSTAAKTALTGLSVSVKQQGTALLITAGVSGQGSPTVRKYVDGARVYVVEASLGDDSGDTDYNLGDDAIVVTDSSGGIVS